MVKSKEISNQANMPNTTTTSCISATTDPAANRHSNLSDKYTKITMAAVSNAKPPCSINSSPTWLPIYMASCGVIDKPLS